jgi:DNA-binding SARP family transcriptional activator
VGEIQEGVMVALKLTVLGGFEARLASGGTVNLPTKKAQALLAYLGVRPGQPHRRDKLAALLWGERSDEHARDGLRHALVALRKALPAGKSSSLLVEAQTLALDPALVEADAATFERRVGEGTPESLEQAAELYRGDLLLGFSVHEPLFEDWLVAERERLRELALEGMAKLLARQRAVGAIEAAIQTGLKLIALDPLHEPVHRMMMRLYAQAGRRAAALRQYQACVSVLQRELGLEPDAHSKQLYQEILKQRPSSRPDAILAAPVAAGGSPHVELATGETRLVERDTDLRRLRQLLHGAVSGHGRLVVVLGEAGIGKSRLAGELAAEASRARARVLIGRSYESEQILAFGPWVEAFRGAGLMATAEPISGLEGVWQAEMGRLLPELGGEAPVSAADHRRVFEAIAHLVARLTAGSPVLLVLEDLHWADEMSCRLLAFIGRRLSQWPLFVVATAREEELPDTPTLRRVLDELEREGKVDTLALGPLSRSGTAKLVEGLTHAGIGAEAIARLAEQVWAASEGNPLMAVETLRALSEGEQTVPSRVRDVATRRLDRLGERAQQVAAVAAVIGREFEFPLLLAAAGMGEDAAAHGVEELVRCRVLQGLEDRFDFTHHCIQQAAYGRLLGPRRKLLHRRVAAALETRRMADPEVEALALGLHYREGEMWDKAVLYLRQAGATAYARGALREARDTYLLALELCPRLDPTRDNLALNVDVRLDLDLMLLALGDLARIPELHREADAIAAQLDDQPRRGRVASRMANHAWLQADYETAITLSRRAIDIAARSGNAFLRVNATHVLGMTLHAQGRYREVVSTLRPNVEGPDADIGRERLGFSIAPYVFGQGLMAWSLAALGEFGAAALHGDAGVRTADASHHRQAQGAARMYHAVALILGEDLRAALPVAEEAVSICESEGVLFWRAAAYSALGWLLALNGRSAEGLPYLAGGAALQAEAGIRGTLSVFWNRWARGLLEAGQLQEAGRTAHRALELAQAAGEHAYMAEAFHVLARIDSELGDVISARDLYQRARDLAAGLEMRPLAARCNLGLGSVARRTADVTRARAHLACAAEEFRALGMLHSLSQAEAEQARLM